MARQISEVTRDFRTHRARDDLLHQSQLHSEDFQPRSSHHRVTFTSAASQSSSSQGSYSPSRHRSHCDLNQFQATPRQRQTEALVRDGRQMHVDHINRPERHVRSRRPCCYPTLHGCQRSQFCIFIWRHSSPQHDHPTPPNCRSSHSQPGRYSRQDKEWKRRRRSPHLSE